MNNELKLAVSVFIFLTCFLLTLFAFANWEVNPSNWGYEARVGFAILEVLILAISLLVGVNANE
jgi:hypothetical protein